MPAIDKELRENFKIEDRGSTVRAKCNFCKFAATTVPSKVGKAYFHTGNLTKHLKRKHVEKYEA